MISAGTGSVPAQFAGVEHDGWLSALESEAWPSMSGMYGGGVKRSGPGGKAKVGSADPQDAPGLRFRSPVILSPLFISK